MKDGRHRAFWSAAIARNGHRGTKPDAARCAPAAGTTIHEEGRRARGTKPKETRSPYGNTTLANAAFTSQA